MLGKPLKKTNSKQDQIYYIGFYSDLEAGSNIERYNSPAAIDKMDYIAKTMTNNGYEVKILSPSWSNSKKFKYSFGETIIKNEKLQIKFTPTISSPFKITRILCQYFSLLWLFWQLLLYTNLSTTVVLYHSVFLYFPILLAKKIKRFRLILEVEEIYHLYTNCSKVQEDALIGLADSYIFSNILLADYLQRKSDKAKTFCVVNGVYRVLTIPPKRVQSQNLLKVVYAGVIEEKKRGAFNAVACAKRLSNKYKTSIIGFGSKESIEKLNMEIDKVNEKAGYNKCEYLGVKTGLDYTEFLFKCDIAISPQEPDESFINFGFPSKLLSYLSHNLRTVTSKLECIATSEFSNCVVMVSDFSPENFAKAIMDLDLQKPFNAIEKIKEADLRFSKELEAMISLLKS